MDQLNTDKTALDAITRRMSGAEWNADTWEYIAAVIRSTGREIKDVGE